MIVGVHQPNFLPWVGFFRKISKSDVFIYFDDITAPKGSSYINRTKLSIDKIHWLTCPLDRSRGHLLSDLEVKNQIAMNKLIKSVTQTLRNEPFYMEIEELIDKLSVLKFPVKIAVMNKQLIADILKTLEIDTIILSSSELNYDRSGDKSQRLLDLVKKVNGTIYLSGAGGMSYLNQDIFDLASIKVVKYDLPYELESMEFYDLNILQFIARHGLIKTKDIVNG